MGPISCFTYNNNFLSTQKFIPTLTQHTIYSILVIFFLCSFSGRLSFAQEVAPLQLGNVWIYEDGVVEWKISIIDTNYTIDGITYYRQQYETPSLVYSVPVRLRDDGFYAVRLDTSYPAPNHEKLYYKKNAVVGDTWKNPTEYFPMVYTIVDTLIQNIFGRPETVKYLDIDGSIVFFKELWTEKFGVLSRTQHPLPSYEYLLKGCVIDGVVWGDTSFVSDVDDNLEPINDFTLSQNFPNPFNPATKINYTIPIAGNVQLRVYNTLGEVVSELINDWHISGNYSVDFIATDLSNGVYFYRIQYGKKSIVKKMILLK